MVPKIPNPFDRAKKQEPRPPQRVLVTGAGSGLGRELARRFAERGDTVIATDLADALDPPAGLPAEATYLQLDVRSEVDWRTVRDHVVAEFGGLDLLVNNAGIAQGGRIDHLTESDWADILDINLHGVARGCRIFVPVFKKQRSGHILNIASLAGLVHPPAMSSYAAVKAGVVAISESLRWELEPDGIGVSVLCPAFFRTNLAGSLNDSDPDISAVASKFIDRASYGPEPVVDAVLKGLDAGTFLILPDKDAAVPYRTKHFAPLVYARQMRAMAERFHAVAARRRPAAS